MLMLFVAYFALGAVATATNLGGDGDDGTIFAHCDPQITETDAQLEYLISTLFHSAGQEGQDLVSPGGQGGGGEVSRKKNCFGNLFIHTVW